MSMIPAAPRSELRSAAWAGSVIALLVVASWIPFGFEVGPTLDEWRALAEIAQGHPLVPTRHPAHLMRPLVFLPNVLAYHLSPESFVGLNAVMAGSMFLKGLLLFVLLRQLLPQRPPGLALLAGALFTLYPAYGSAFWGTAMAGHFGQAFFLLALTSFLAWRASGAAALLVVTGVALTVTCGLSENVYPFALMAPALFLRDARESIRRFLRDTLLWLIVPVLFILNYVRVAAAGPSSYQRSLLATPSLAQALSSIGGAYAFTLEGAWTARVPLDRGVLSLGLSVALAAAAGVVAWFLWSGKAPAASPPGLLSARGLTIAGLAVVAAGYLPYLFTVLRDEPTRTMLYCSLGGALLWAAAVDGLAARLGGGRWLFAGLSGVLVGVALAKGLAQHRHYRDWARTQQNLLRPVARALEHSARSDVAVLVEGVPAGVFAEGVLRSALTYLLPVRPGAAIVCDFGCAHETTAMVVAGTEGIPAERPIAVPYEQLLLFRSDGRGGLQLASRLPRAWHLPEEVEARYRPQALLSGPAHDAPRLRSALETEPRSASAAPPGTPCPYVWEFDDAIASGAGWEEHVEGRSELWSVARRATLNLHLDTRHDHRLRIVIAYALSPSTLASLRVEVNGEPVTLRRRTPPHAGEFVGTIPREIVALDSDITELAFLVDGLDVPAPPSPDRRSLGLLFDRLEITPAGS